MDNSMINSEIDVERFEPIAQKLRSLINDLPCGPFVKSTHYDAMKEQTKWSVVSPHFREPLLSTEHLAVAQFLSEAPELVFELLVISYQIAFNSGGLDNK